jgi:hypothetical protein
VNLQPPTTHQGSGGSPQAALIVAHPGHELMVYHWMERSRPLYVCLTDGSGGSGASRIASTSRLLATVGATRGPICGRWTDREFYQLLVGGRADELARLARELADTLIESGVECVAGDAIEGFNPTHDVCRLIIDGAVAIAQRRGGGRLDNYEFTLESPAPDRTTLPDGALCLDLDEDALERKLRAALDYDEMRDEVAKALERFGRQAFAVECLRPAATERMLERFATEPPLYEQYGHMRVEQGVYREVIHYREHVARVRAAIEEEARRP